MKQLIWLLVLLVLAGVACMEAQTVQAGIVTDSPTSFVVRAKVSGGGFTDVPFSGVIVTVFWPTSAGVALGSPSSGFSVGKAGSVGTEGSDSYQKFASTPNVNITWADGDVVDLFTVNVTGGTSPTTFELRNPADAGVNGAWYFEVSGGEYTNTTTPFYAPSTELALPVTMSAFAGKMDLSASGVKLEWKTLSEVNNYGFTVQRKGENAEEFADLEGAFIEGKGTTLDPQSYSYLDRTVNQGTWDYRLKQQDLDGTVQFSQSVRVVVTVTDVAETTPKVFDLSQNYPNPFNPTTMIEFALPKESRITLAVYNLLGQRVATLVEEFRPAGYYAVPFNAGNLASGLYIYKLTADQTSFVRKMMVVK